MTSPVPEQVPVPGAPLREARRLLKEVAERMEDYGWTEDDFVAVARQVWRDLP